MFGIFISLQNVQMIYVLTNGKDVLTKETVRYSRFFVFQSTNKELNCDQKEKKSQWQLYSEWGRLWSALLQPPRPRPMDQTERFFMFLGSLQWRIQDFPENPTGGRHLNMLANFPRK